MTAEISDKVSEETSLKYAFFTGLAPDGGYVMLPTNRTSEFRIRLRTLASGLREYKFETTR